VPQPVVVFDRVWKKFRRGERHDSLRDLIPSLVKRAFTRPRGDELKEQEFWALEEVAFEVRPGEALGIIGPNGAGKSTTLKLLTKILKPSQGRCSIRGRAGALIEVAAGFHPDLTGRENVFLQGAILGMTRADVLRKFDAIVDFAGVGEFIDTPIKRYSSGMNARLGFAIAVNLDPDALIIDEVLSVGDMAFQERCVQHMRDFKKRGVAIVFVSHNLQAVADLCEQSVHLNHSVKCAGPTPVVLDSYIRSRSAAVSHPASVEAAICAVRLVDEAGRPVERVGPGTDLVLQVEYSIQPSMTDLTFGVLLHRSTDGLTVYDANFTPAEVGIDLRTLSPGEDTSGPRRVRVDYQLRANVTRGHYHFDCHVFHNATQRVLHRITPAAQLSVHEKRTWAGIADLDVRPVTQQQLQTAIAR
jgi:lipopolysaccharide transport system ATP-binding protein